MRLARHPVVRALTCVGVAAAGLMVMAGWFLLDGTPPPLSRAEHISTLVEARDGSLLHGFLADDGAWRLTASPDSVDPLYLQMLIAAEDQRFESHGGYDSLAILRAAGQWIGSRRIVSGASTLTMQTVRLLQHHPRTLLAKIEEARDAAALERELPKRRILGLYLTVAPFGGNLEGVRAASLAYFAKEPTRLTPSEAALLVALPQSPERLRPDRHPEAARRARDRILSRMVEHGVLTDQAAAEAMQDAVPTRRIPLPAAAPQLSNTLHRGGLAEPESGDRAVIRTTIDPVLQSVLERIARVEISRLEPGASIAALVIDNPSRKVLAYVGGTDPRATDSNSADRRSFVDMVQAIRSPGSTLKPFIYGLAFDARLLHPETIVEDRQQLFQGGYEPGNFDGRYMGEVTAREALQNSLNVPAVAVLDKLGPARFMAALAQVGIHLHLPHRTLEPGLPIALGGVGTSLWDLATLYCGLASGGAVAPLQIDETAVAGKARPLLEKLGSYYVTKALVDAPPPSGVLPAEVRQGRHIAFKTGTSYGFRDAWAMGYDRDFTIGVWVGRPDGSPSPGHIGRNTAAPLVFRIADLLPATQGDTMNQPPPEALREASHALPMALRHLDAGVGPRREAGPHITFPKSGTEVEWHSGEMEAEAAGGTAPFSWLIDGSPIGMEQRQKPIAWTPAGSGFTRITVVDGAGHSDESIIRLVN